MFVYTTLCLFVHNAFIFKYLLLHRSFIYLFLSVFILFLSMLGLCCWEGFSLVVASGGHFPVAVHELLIAVASLVAQHGLQDTWAFSSHGSQALEHKLSSCGTQA